MKNTSIGDSTSQSQNFVNNSEISNKLKLKQTRDSKQTKDNFCRKILKDGDITESTLPKKPIYIIQRYRCRKLNRTNVDVLKSSSQQSKIRSETKRSYGKPL